MRTFAYTVEEAERFVAEGTPGVADMLLWTMLGKNPRQAGAWEALSKVAAAIGGADVAARYAGVAASLSGGVAPVSSTAAGGTGLASTRAKGAESRYLVIKAWTCGFCSDLEHTLAGLLLAEITGRTPVTHWGADSLFSVDAKRDAFREYFEPLAPETLDDVLNATQHGGECWPPKWNRENLHTDRPKKPAAAFLGQEGGLARAAPIQFLFRPERVCVAEYHLSTPSLVPWIPEEHPMHGHGIEAVLRYLFGRLRPRADLRGVIESFAAERFRSRPIIAVHVRGTDKWKEDPLLKQRHEAYPHVIEQMSKGTRCPVFLMTDSKQVADEYQRRYGARLILPPAIRSDSLVGVHLLPNPNADRRRIGVEVVRDIYLAAQCDMFIGLGSSNVSAAVHHLKEWAPGTTLYAGELTMHQADPSQYMYLEQFELYCGKEWVEQAKAGARAWERG